jgi:hypothetical protein
MENDNGLPVFSGPADHLRYGFRSLETEMNASHPVDMMQRSRNESNWNSKLDMVRRTYGSHMAMRLATERATFNRSHRLPRLQSSNIGFETLMGTDTTINFEDFLNGM